MERSELRRNLLKHPTKKPSTRYVSQIADLIAIKIFDEKSENMILLLYDHIVIKNKVAVFVNLNEIIIM